MLVAATTAEIAIPSTILQRLRSPFVAAAAAPAAAPRTDDVSGIAVSDRNGNHVVGLSPYHNSTGFLCFVLSLPLLL